MCSEMKRSVFMNYQTNQLKLQNLFAHDDSRNFFLYFWCNYKTLVANTLVSVGCYFYNIHNINDSRRLTNKYTWIFKNFFLNNFKIVL